MEEAKASDSAKTKKAYEEVVDDEGIQPEFLTKFTGSYERILIRSETGMNFHILKKVRSWLKASENNSFR